MYEIKIIETDSYPQNKRFYGGRAGKKYGISIDGQNWLVKFPKSTVEFNKAGVSYTTSPVSEFLGSHIYELAGIPVHETHLGVRNNKIVCLCKDMALPYARWTEFREIKNASLRDDEVYSDSGTSGEGTILNDVLDVIAMEPVLQDTPGLKERFWDMFVVDAFIRNGDRNNTNWGIYIYEDGSSALIPVYDNGNAFFTSRNAEQNALRLEQAELIEQDAFGTYRSRFLTDDKHGIDAFKMIAEQDNADLSAAVDRFVSRIDINKVLDFIDRVPDTYKGLDVLPKASKELYKEVLRKHYYEGFLPFSSFR